MSSLARSLSLLLYCGSSSELKQVWEVGSCSAGGGGAEGGSLIWQIAGEPTERGTSGVHAGSPPESGPARWMSSGSLPRPPTGALSEEDGAGVPGAW
jgi:hypothetical protein